MDSPDKNLSPEFLYQQNLSFLQSFFPGRFTISNEEFARVLGRSPTNVSLSRKTGGWPVTMGTKRAGKILLTEAARWLLSFMQLSPTPQNPAQARKPAPASTPPIDIPIKESAPDFTETPRPPVRTGKRGRSRGSRNRAKENLVWDPSHFNM